MLKDVTIVHYHNSYLALTIIGTFVGIFGIVFRMQTGYDAIQEKRYADTDGADGTDSGGVSGTPV